MATKEPRTLNMTNGTAGDVQGLADLIEQTPLQTGVVGPYQGPDRQVIDYQHYKLGRSAFRGPPPPDPRQPNKVSFLGAAQTFGRFVRVPFPNILGSLYGIDILNLGHAGAGPSFYLDQPRLLRLASNSRAAVIQVMSGRSVSNSLFSSSGRNILTRRSDGEKMLAAQAYTWIMETRTEKETLAIVKEAQDRWVHEMSTLADSISAPKILFWFSVRSQDFTPKVGTFASLLGNFPQLVTRDMIEQVMTKFETFVECTTERGLPQTLTHRVTGRLVRVSYMGRRVSSKNSYYPSPQMHLDAAHALEMPLGDILEKTSRT